MWFWIYMSWRLFCKFKVPNVRLEALLSWMRAFIFSWVHSGVWPDYILKLAVLFSLFIIYCTLSIVCFIYHTLLSPSPVVLQSNLGVGIFYSPPACISVFCWPPVLHFDMLSAALSTESNHLPLTLGKWPTWCTIILYNTFFFFIIIILYVAASVV